MHFLYALVKKAQQTDKKQNQYNKQSQTKHSVFLFFVDAFMRNYSFLKTRNYFRYRE